MQSLIEKLVKCTSQVAGFLAMCTFVSQVSAQATIAGKYEVTALGAATYSVPVQVPPGVSGVEPKLSLTYNSKAGNGVLGVGWSLDGLPSIVRCRQMRPQDGANGAVTFTASDRFCYNGKRLMSVSGVYGAANSSYRTEIESFVRVTSLGAAGTGPQYFTVRTREGVTMEFGNTPDSRVLVPGQSTVRIWALNKLVDVKGNYLNVTYAQPDTGFYYPARIDYTGNAAQGLAATSAVTFEYSEGRGDVVRGYQAGAPYLSTRLLSSITTWTNNSQVLKYKPTYVAGAGNRTTMTSLSLCDPSNLCAAETRFEWGGVTGALYTPPNAQVKPISATESTSAAGNWIAFDVNNDGLTDLVHLVYGAANAPSYQYRVWLSNGDGTFVVKEFVETQDQIIQPLNDFGFWFVSDIDGDGKADLVHARSATNALRIWRNNGDGSFSISTAASAVDADFSSGVWRSADINGDGLPDLLHFYVGSTTPGGSDYVYSWISNGDGTFSVTRFFGYNGLNNGNWQLLDVNGDGMTDMVMFFINPQNMNPGDSRVWLSNGDGTFSVTRWVNTIDTSPAEGVWQQVDLNGDGLVDLVHMYASTTLSGTPVGASAAWINKGNGTFDIAWYSTTVDTLLTNGGWQLVDINGDGLIDMVHFPPQLSYGYYWTWTSKGNGQFDVVKVTGQSVDTCLPMSPSPSCNQFLAGDFLGSGAVGLVRIDSESSPRFSWFLSSPKANLVTSVTDGLGGKTAWSFSPLPAMAKRGTYVREDAGNASIWNLIASNPSVDTVYRNLGFVSANSGQSSAAATSYSYGSLRYEPKGRGLLGFQWVQARDSETQLISRTVYRQDFPYIGMIAGKGMGRGGNWNNLELLTTNYGCTMLEVASNCVVAPGGRYFVYPSQVTHQRWDLDGTAFPVDRAIYENPDIYGNLRTVRNKTLTPGLLDTDYSTVTTTDYWNDPTNWFLGMPVKVVTERTGPTVAPPVAPGSGGLPAAPAPSPPGLSTAVLIQILSLLLDD